MRQKIHDFENETNEVRFPKMGAAIGIIREWKHTSVVPKEFVRRGNRLDLFGVSHAFIYALVFDGLVHAEHRPEEREFLEQADLEAWRQGLVSAVLAIRCVPPMGIGARQNHDWSCFTKGGFLAHQMTWRMLNTIGHRELGTPWPTPAQAARKAVLDYMETVIRFGRTYQSSEDYTGEKWFADTPEQFKLLYRIDPALLGRCENCADSTVMETVDPGFSKYLEMVFSVEPDPRARMELIKNTWDIQGRYTSNAKSLPNNIAIDF